MCGEGGWIVLPIYFVSNIQESDIIIIISLVFRLLKVNWLELDRVVGFFFRIIDMCKYNSVTVSYSIIDYLYDNNPINAYH